MAFQCRVPIHEGVSKWWAVNKQFLRTFRMHSLLHIADGRMKHSLL